MSQVMKKEEDADPRGDKAGRANVGPRKWRHTILLVD